LYLKGGDLSTELKNFKAAKIFNISNYFNQSFFETKKVVYLPIPYKDKDTQ
jgi:16S rRNA (guanine527-N7)-methyltransferase